MFVFPQLSNIVQFTTDSQNIHMHFDSSLIHNIL
jgi:hypothetical protein